MTPSRQEIDGTAGPAGDRSLPAAPYADTARGAAARGRRLVSGIATTALSRSIGLLAPLILIPVHVRYLGGDIYGLWMAVIGLTGMAAFADLGLGNGLMTRLSSCYATADADRARRYISSAYATLGSLALAACSMLLFTADLIPWSSIFNTAGSATPSDARVIAVVCLTAFICNIPLSLINRVQYAYQQVGTSNMWQAAGSAAALPLALTAVHAGARADVVVAATMAGPILGNVCNSGWFYCRKMPELAPRLRHVDAGALKHLFQLSGLFLTLTIIMSMANNADTLIIAYVLDLQSVTAYAVPAKLCSVVGMLVSLLNLPLWPANADALTRGHLDWVRRTTRRMTLISALAVLAPSAVLVLGGPVILSPSATGIAVEPDRWLFAGLVAWWMLLAAASPRFMVQNAAGVIRPQLVGWLLYLLLSLPAKWFAATRVGIAAVPFAGVAVYLVTVLPAAARGYRLALSQHPTRPEAASVSNSGHQTGSPQ